MYLKYLNLALLVLFPIAWFAPLARAGWLPFFDLDAISVITGLQSLWESDIFLALIVMLFAIILPILKTGALAAIHFRVAGRRALPVLEILGKLAMADVFLIAVYIVIAKGMGVGRVETGWGLYLFTACVFASMWITHQTKKT